MKIKRLLLKNFRGISDIEIEFDGKSTIIYGVNGMGKSTVLDACDIIFSKILGEASMDKQIGGLLIKEKDVKLGENKTEISTDIIIEGKVFSYYRKRVDGTNSHKKSLLKKIADYIRRQYIGESYEGEADEDEGYRDDWETAYILKIDEKRDMPVYISYGINRYIDGRRLLRKKYTGAGGKLDAWRDDVFNGSIDFDLFFEWFRGRQEYENSIKVENTVFEDEQLNAAREAVLAVLGEDFSSIKIKINDDAAGMVLVKKGLELSIKQLSEGERSMVALTGDLARRLAIANPGIENPLMGSGIVLIDEIDLHLHPVWQAKIVPILLKIFPNIQFIVTTHSPKVLGEIGDEVTIIKLDAQEEITAEKIKPLNGWDVNTILQEYMGTDAIHAETKKKIDNMFELIEQKKYDEAEAIADELENMTDNKNLDVVRGRILIARGR